jgi:hypothetical protein
VEIETPARPAHPYLRDLSVTIQAIGMKGGPLRVYLRDGAVIDAKWLGSAYDQLFVGQHRQPALELLLSSVTRIDRRELLRTRALGLGCSVVVVGAIFGAAWDVVHGDPMRWHDGLGLGVISAALAAPFIVWLAQDLPWFKQWRVIIDEPAHASSSPVTRSDA